jgi:hypothetical protein
LVSNQPAHSPAMVLYCCTVLLCCADELEELYKGVYKEKRLGWDRVQRWGIRLHH